MQCSISICSSLCCVRKSARSDQFFRPSTSFQKHCPPASIPRDQRFPPSCVRSACWFQDPGGAWIIGRSLRGRHGPWSLHTMFSREGGRVEAGEQRKGVSTRISRSSRERAREGPGPDLWMGPDPRSGRRCRLAEPGTTLVPGSTNRWLVSPLSSRLFLLLVLSFSFFFLLLVRLPISIPSHLLLSSLPTSISSLSLVRLSSLLKMLWSSLLVFYSKSISRQLCTDDCPEIIAGKLGEYCCQRDFFLSIILSLEIVMIRLWE